MHAYAVGFPMHVVYFHHTHMHAVDFPTPQAIVDHVLTNGLLYMLPLHPSPFTSSCASSSCASSSCTSSSPLLDPFVLLLELYKHLCGPHETAPGTPVLYVKDLRTLVLVRDCLLLLQ